MAVSGSTLLFGNTQYLSIPATSGLVFGSNNFSVESWIYVESAPSSGDYSGVVDQWPNSSGSWTVGQWELGLYNNPASVSDFVATGPGSGGSISFNGSSQYLNLPTSSNLALGTNNFTIECWFYLNALPTGGFQIIDTATFNGISASITSTTQVQLALAQVTGYNWTCSTLSTGVWYHLAFCRVGTTTTAYLNGVSLGTNTISGSFVTPTTPYIGAAASLSSYFNGYITNLRIVNGTAVYTSAFTPPTAPLTSVTNTQLLLDVLTSSLYLSDGSPNNFAVTNTGGATFQNSSPYPIVGGSIVFNNSYLISSSTLLSQTQSTFTIEGWIYMTANPTSTSNIPSLIGDMFAYSGPTNNWSFGPYINGSNINLAFYWNSGSQNFCYGTGTNMNLNTWYHIAVSVSSNTIKMYVDGVSQTLSGTTTLSNRSSTAGQFVLGTYYSTQSIFYGYATSIRFVNGTAVYTSNFTPPLPPLSSITNTQLLLDVANSSTYLADSSPSNYSITAVNLLSNPLDVAFYYATSASTYSQVVAANSIPLGQWVHVAFVRSGTGTNQCDLYVNGQSLSRGTVSQTIGVNAAGSIGRETSPSTYWVSGYVSGVRIVNGIATYTGNFIPPTTTLNAITGTQLLLNMYNSTYWLTDESPNNLTITAVGSPQFANNVTPYLTAPGSIYFNAANGNYLSFAGNSTFALGSNDFTVELYFLCNSLPSTGSPDGFFQILDTSTNNGLSVAIGGATNTTLYLSLAGVTTYSFTCPTITAGIWHHLAFSGISGTVTAFLDGVACGTNSITGFVAGTTYTIGSKAAFSDFFDGEITNFHIINGTGKYTGNFTVPQYLLGATQNANFNGNPSSAIGGINTALLLDVSNSTNYITDSSVNNLTITAVNSPPYSSSSPPLYPSSNPGGSISFDGSSQYLTLAANSLLNITTGASFTIEAYIYQTAISSGGGSGIVVQDDGASNGQCFQYRINTSLKPEFIYFTGSGRSPTIITGSTAINLNTWNHVAVTYDGSSVRLFLNGAVIANTLTSAANFYSASVSTGIGNYNSSAFNLYFAGDITNVRIVNGTAVYTSAFTPPTAPLTSVTNTQLLLDVLTSALYLNDSSPNNLTVTPVNSPTYLSNTPYVSLTGGSISFDGSSQYLSVPSNTRLAVGTNDFTVEFWIYLNSSSSTTPGDIFYTYNTLGSGSGNYLTVSITSTQIQLSRYNTGADLTATYSVPLNTWTHIAVTRKSGIAYIFANGIFLTSGAVSTSYLQSGAIIGAGGSGTIYYTNGYISNLRLVNGVAVYTHSFVPPSGPIQATANSILLLDSASNSSLLTDSSQNNLKITSGNPTYATYASDSPYTVIIRNTSPYTGSPKFYSNGATLTSALAETVAGPCIINYTSNMSSTNTTSLAVPVPTGVVAGDLLVFTALTQSNSATTTISAATFTGTLTNGNSWITSISANTNIAVGQLVTSTTSGITGGTTVSSVNATTVVMSSTFTGTTTASASVNTYLTPVTSSKITDGQLDYAIVVATGFESGTYTALSNTSYLYGVQCTHMRGVSNTITYSGLNTSSFSTPAPIYVSNAVNSVAKYYPNNVNECALSLLGFLSPGIGGSLSFSGSSQYVSVPASFTSVTTTTPFTWECWVYPTAQLNGTGILASSFPGSGAVPFALYGGSAGGGTSGSTLVFGYFNGSAWTTIASSTSLTLNTWSHIAAAFTGTVLTLYLNGTSIASGTVSWTTAAATSPFYIGRRWDTSGSSNYFSGYITNVRYVTGTALYTSNFTPSTFPLSAYYANGALNTNTLLLLNMFSSSASLVDSSKSYNSISNTGAVAFSTLSPFSSANVLTSASVTCSTAQGANQIVTSYSANSTGFVSGLTTSLTTLSTPVTIFSNNSSLPTVNVSSYFNISLNSSNSLYNTTALNAEYVNYTLGTKSLSTPSAPNATVNPPLKLLSSSNGMQIAELVEANYVNVLVAGGGGGGGGGYTTGGTNFSGGGGGGAGAYVYGTIPVTEQWDITIGTGGSGGIASNATKATNGTPSYIVGHTTSFPVLYALGGGAGDDANTGTGGANGASGGGASVSGVSGKALSQSYIGCPAGFAGGNSNSSTGPLWSGGGGGGANSAGSNATSGSVAGTGGSGVSNSITGTAVTYCVGGNGGNTGSLAGANGSTAGSGGGGGGGGSGTNIAANGGYGANGIVIISYPGTTALFTGGTITTVGSNTVHTFTTNASLVQLGISSVGTPGPQKLLANGVFICSQYSE